MGKKVGINLIVSDEMTQREEHDVVRLPLKSRQNFALVRGKVILGKGEYQKEVSIKAAFRPDVRRILGMIRSGKMTEQDALLVGFVSKPTHAKLSQKGGDDIWISSDVDEITVGCDPEFGLIMPNGCLARGDLILPDTKTRPFGEDGPGVEVRPAPSRRHLEVVNNIAAVLQAAPAEADPYRWVGGATYTDKNRTYWFGGHIHFGRPSDLSAEKAETLFQVIAWILDYYLAWPMTSFDTPEPFKRREGCEHEYGMAGDIRTKAGNSRFEYRVLSGLWVTHPTLACIAMGTAKAVAEAVYIKARRQGYSRDYIGDGPEDRHAPIIDDMVAKAAANFELQNAINKATVKPLSKSRYEQWVKQFRELETYELYRDEIEALISLVKFSPTTVVPELSLDIKENWLVGRALLQKPNPELAAALKAVEEKL